MRLLTSIHGLYGERIIENIRQRGPKSWALEVLELPKVLPVIVDEPEEYLPEDIPNADLILHMAETSPAAQLIPVLAKRSRAKAVIAPVDHDTWIPMGLRLQLKE